MTRDELRNAGFRTEFHYAPACRRTVGPKGGVTVKNETWRINGAMVEFKTRPEEFRRPVKHGLRSYGYIDQHNVAAFVLAHTCPVCHGESIPDSAASVTTTQES